MRYIIFSNDEEVEITQSSNHNNVVIKCKTFDQAVNIAKKYSAYDWSYFTIRRVQLNDDRRFEYNNYILDHYRVENIASGPQVEFYPRLLSNEEIYKSALDILMGNEE